MSAAATEIAPVKVGDLLGSKLSAYQEEINDYWGIWARRLKHVQRQQEGPAMGEHEFKLRDARQAVIRPVSDDDLPVMD